MPHTKGPWRAVNHAPLGWFIQFDGVIKDATIASMNSACMAYNNAKADAILIAAAPELLAACKAMVNWDNNFPDMMGIDFQTVKSQIEAAIAKAEGRDV